VHKTDSYLSGSLRSRTTCLQKYFVALGDFVGMEGSIAARATAIATTIQLRLCTCAGNSTQAEENKQKFETLCVRDGAELCVVRGVDAVSSGRVSLNNCPEPSVIMTGGAPTCSAACAPAVRLAPTHASSSRSKP
jgi:hypothetical protein